MITPEDTTRRTPGVANVRISGQIFRRRLRESGLRARRPMVGPILRQHHRDRAQSLEASHLTTHPL
jgi:hypothetical protein